METKTVNLRDLPEDFVRQAKAYAALSGMTLKDFVIKAVQDAMQDETKLSASNSGILHQDKPRKRR
jgi:hypothetical protein